MLSVILSAFGFGGLVYGLSKLGAAAAIGSRSAAWVPLVVGVVALALFILRQLSAAARDVALLDLRTFTTPHVHRLDRR